MDSGTLALSPGAANGDRLAFCGFACILDARWIQSGCEQVSLTEEFPALKYLPVRLNVKFNIEESVCKWNKEQ
jgi:hypothetical protein